MFRDYSVKGGSVPVKILISGWYGFNNTGDEAILLSLMDAIQNEIGEAEFIILSERPRQIIANYSKDYRITSIKHLSLESKEGFVEYFLKGRFLGLVHSIYRCNLFLLGGGGILRDNTTARNLRKVIDECVFARLLRKKVAYGLIGVGPVISQRGAKLIGEVTKRVDLITVRDNESKKILNNLLVDCRRSIMSELTQHSYWRPNLRPILKPLTCYIMLKMSNDLCVHYAFVTMVCEWI